MEQNQDFSLLREFDIQAARNGEPICGNSGAKMKFIGMASNGNIVTETIDNGWVGSYSPSVLRMDPLCWFEAKPVYKGDVLYWRDDLGEIHEHIAESVRGNHGTNELQVWQDSGDIDDRGYVILRSLFWDLNPKKYEGWMISTHRKLDTQENVMKAIWKTEQLAKANAPAGSRIVHVQWEE